MENVIIVAVVLIVVALAVLYIYKAKKSGKKCIGCSDGCCSKKDSLECCCGCSNIDEKKQ